MVWPLLLAEAAAVPTLSLNVLNAGIMHAHASEVLDELGASPELKGSAQESKAILGAASTPAKRPELTAAPTLTASRPVVRKTGFNSAHKQTYDM